MQKQNYDKEQLQRELKIMKRMIFSVFCSILFMYILDDIGFFKNDILSVDSCFRAITAALVGLGLGWRIGR